MNVLEPFTGGWGQILIWYIGTLIVMLALAVVLKKIGFVDDEFEKFSGPTLVVLGVLLLPPLEEFAFRYVPLEIFGMTGLAVGSILWILAHGKRSIAIAPSAIFYYKLWAAGMGWEAALIHMAHNAVFIGIYLYGRRKKRNDRLVSPRSIDL